MVFLDFVVVLGFTAIVEGLLAGVYSVYRS